jgi:tetratricopeptide (TPR) repeat protein
MALGNETPDQSPSQGDEFIFVTLTDKFLEQFDIPKQPCPLRTSTFENALPEGVFDFSLLADECILYHKQHPENQPDVRPLLARLCNIAGVNAGQDGDAHKAQYYFDKAYCIDPCDIQVASNFALALCINDQIDDALDVYEQVITDLQNGRLEFIPEIWTEAVKIHHMKGNYKRALELVEISIQEAPQYFGDDAKAFAQELRNEIANS